MSGGVLLFAAGILLIVIAFHRSWGAVWSVLFQPAGTGTSPASGTGVKG